jgi:hypothetical protein
MACHLRKILILHNYYEKHQRFVVENAHGGQAHCSLSNTGTASQPPLSDIGTGGALPLRWQGFRQPSMIQGRAELPACRLLFSGIFPIATQ